jgi:hypothetical protein
MRIAGLVGLLLLCAGLVWWSGSRTRSETPQAPVAEASKKASKAHLLGEEESTAASSREPSSTVATKKPATEPQPGPPDLGALSGRVVDEEGRPIADLHIEVALEGLLEEGWMTSRELYRRTRAEEVRDGGDPLDSTWTGSDGRFRCPHLMDRAYDVWVALEPLQFHRLTAAPVPADGRELELVYERSRLVVRVLDEEGAPWARIETLEDVYGRTLELHSPPTTRVSHWPSRPGVRVDSLDQIVGPHVDTAPPPGVPFEDTLVFEARQGLRYRIGLFGGEQPWRPVTVTAGPGRTDVVLQVVTPRPCGELAVSVSDSAGPVEDRVEIRVEDPDDGFVLLRTSPSPRWPQMCLVPEGAWRVVVDGVPTYTYDEMDLIQKTRHGRFETRVTVQGGETTTVEAALPVGALLQATASGIPPVGVELGDRWWDVLDHGVRLTLRAPGRWPHLVVFEGPPRRPGPEMLQRLVLNTTATSERLPSGRWTLVGELPDGRVQSTEVVLVDGETTRARLEFGAPPPAGEVAPVR